MNLNKKSTICALLAILPIAPAHADVLAEWTFNSGNSAARRASQNVVLGASVSGLSFNDSFTDFGSGAVPNDVHDGIGFGGSGPDQVMFLHRAIISTIRRSPTRDRPWMTKPRGATARYRAPGPNFIHNGKANVAFLDGHVQAFSLNEVPTDTKDVFWNPLATK
jgi:prepilin-type processing-associated H-X9-DG protein